MPIKRVMGLDHKWIEQFGIPASEIAQWKTKEEALLALLLENELPESEYLKWASKHFEVPVVKNEFFAIPPDLIFWDQVKSVHAWSWSLFPLYEWNGVMLIACVIPPEDLKLKSVHRLVLASAKEMKAFWTKLNPKAKDQKQETTRVQASSTLDSTGVRPQSGSFEDLEARLGLSKIYSENQLPQDTEADLLLSGPEGLTFTGIKIGAPKIDFVKNDFAEQNENSEPTGFALNSETSISSKFDFTGVWEQPKEEEPRAKEFTQTGIAPVRPIECSANIDELAELAVQHVEKIFTGSMIFLYQNDQLIPWKWNQALTSDENANLNAIDLTTPSIFRITFRSKLPYHGYVTPSPVNDEFFAAFNKNKKPAHVTVVPILWEKQLLGMILGLSDIKLDYTSNMSEMQEIAKELAQHITRLRESIAA